MKRLLMGVMAFCAIVLLFSCSDNDIADDVHNVTPPNPNLASAMISFSPDSGGVGTSLIIDGKNLGTDTSCVKVTVNGKNAPVIGVNNEVLYATVPARADTGYVKLYVTKNGKTEEFTSDRVFRYQFKRNVSTVAGQAGQSSRMDGSYSEARFQRPWFVTHDKEGVIYEIDEGRGTNKNGALRRLKEGLVENLIEDNAGVFQSPTVAAFNAAQDTMYMTHMYNSRNCTSRVGLILITRASGFVDSKALVRMDDVEPQLTGLAVNPVDGQIIFSNNADGYLYLYTPRDDNDISLSFKKLHRVRNQSGTEMRLVFSPDGKYLYELLKNRHCICRTAYDPVTHTLADEDEIFAGQWSQSGYQDGVGTAALFNQPSAGEFDEDGNLFVADKYNHCIRKITPQGEVSLWAGSPGQSGYKDGLPNEAKFNQPEGLTIMPDQSIIVADRENSVIRKVVVE